MGMSSKWEMEFVIRNDYKDHIVVVGLMFVLILILGIELDLYSVNFKFIRIYLRINEMWMLYTLVRILHTCKHKKI